MGAIICSEIFPGDTVPRGQVRARIQALIDQARCSGEGDWRHFDIDQEHDAPACASVAAARKFADDFLCEPHRRYGTLLVLPVTITTYSLPKAPYILLNGAPADAPYDPFSSGDLGWLRLDVDTKLRLVGVTHLRVAGEYTSVVVTHATVPSDRRAELSERYRVAALTAQTLYKAHQAVIDWTRALTVCDPTTGRIAGFAAGDGAALVSAQHAAADQMRAARAPLDALIQEIDPVVRAACPAMRTTSWFVAAIAHC